MGLTYPFNGEAVDMRNDIVKSVILFPGFLLSIMNLLATFDERFTLSYLIFGMTEEEYKAGGSPEGALE